MMLTRMGDAIMNDDDGPLDGNEASPSEVDGLMCDARWGRWRMVKNFSSGHGHFRTAIISKATGRAPLSGLVLERNAALSLLVLECKKSAPPLL